MPLSKQGPGKYSRAGKITDNGIAHFLFDLRDGDAHPEDARASLLSLRQALLNGRELTRHQSRFLAQGLERFAKGMTLNQAFGLERPKSGRRAVLVQRQIEIAAEVLRGILDGRKLEAAAIQAGSRCGISATQARKYWAQNKMNAIRLVRAERESRPLSDSEHEILKSVKVKLLGQTQKAAVKRLPVDDIEFVGLWTKIPPTHRALGNSAPEKEKK